MAKPKLTAAELAERIRAYREHGTIRGAARALKIDPSSMRQSILYWERENPNALGLAPAGPALGVNPHYIKGVSSLVGPDGQVKLQWLKTASRPAEIAAAIEEHIEKITDTMPAAPKVPVPRLRPGGADVAVQITVTDLHIGMYASAAESGDGGWDLEKAKHAALSAVKAAVMLADPGDTVILSLLGDLLHYDPPFQMTPTSKHPVTSDGRPYEMVDTALDLIDEIIGFLLANYRHVVVVPQEGNHDIGSSIWLTRYIQRLWRQNPRVEVVASPTPFTEYAWGDVLLVYHHSHKVRKDKLMRAVPALFRQKWGASRFCYVHSGHYHHLESKEDGGLEWLQHPTVAGRDDYATGLGLMAVRRLLAISYHKRYGELSRRSVTPELAEHLCQYGSI